MKGYFIPMEIVKKFDLLTDPRIKEGLQETFIAITDRDVFESSQNVTQIRNESIPKKIYNEIGNWFYRNYYDVLMDIIRQAIENEKSKK